WEPQGLRSTTDSALASHVPIDATPTWVLSNHDVTRPVTRYGRADTAFSFEAKRAGTPTDRARGTRRARAAALLTMALPGSMLTLYRRGLQLRREAPWGADGALDWLPGRDDVLAFTRGPHFICLTNFGPEPAPLPPGTELLLSSSDVSGGAVPQDTTVWL